MRNKELSLYLLAGLTFIVSLSGLMIMYYSDLETKIGSNWIFENIKFFSYFTILSNLFVAITTGIHLFKGLKLPQWIRSAVFIYISITGIVYHVALRPVWNPKGIMLLADILLHYVTPLAYLVYWIFGVEVKGILHYSFFYKVLYFPLGYLFYTIIKGLFSGHYPYPFLELNKIGVLRFTINSIVITLLIVMLAIPTFYFVRWRSKSN